MSANKVNRTVQQMVDHAKDTVAQNIALAASRGEIRGLDSKTVDIEKLVNIVKASIDQAYLMSGRHLDAAIKDLVSPGTKKNAS